MTSNTVPTSKEELLAQIEQKWTALQDLVNQLSAEEFEIPGPDGWSVKDQLAHIMHWEQWLIRHHIGGESPQEILKMSQQEDDELDVDELNDIIFQQHHERPLQDILEESQKTHQQTVALLSAMSYDDFMRPRYPDDPEGRPLLNWILGDTTEHYEEHTPAIQAILDQRQR